MGAEAVLTLIEATSDSPAMVITLDGNQIMRKRLMDCVQKVSSIFTFCCDLSDYPTQPKDSDWLAYMI